MEILFSTREAYRIYASLVTIHWLLCGKQIVVVLRCFRQETFWLYSSAVREGYRTSMIAIAISDRSRRVLLLQRDCFLQQPRR
jgi:hypothetical protein